MLGILWKQIKTIQNAVPIPGSLSSTLRQASGYNWKTYIGGCNGGPETSAQSIIQRKILQVRKEVAERKYNGEAETGNSSLTFFSSNTGSKGWQMRSAGSQFSTDKKQQLITQHAEFSER